MVSFEGSAAAPLELPSRSWPSSRSLPGKRFVPGIDNGGMELTLRGMARGFLPYTLDQRLLLPPDMRSWLAEGHAALFVSDVVDALDLSAIYKACETGDDRGRAA